MIDQSQEQENTLSLSNESEECLPAALDFDRSKANESNQEEALQLALKAIQNSVSIALKLTERDTMHNAVFFQQLSQTSSMLISLRAGLEDQNLAQEEQVSTQSTKLFG